MLLAAKKEQSVPFLDASWLSENSRPGQQLLHPQLQQVIELVNSLNASGLATSLYDDGRRSRSTGKERDQESGLDYFGARYYGSALGRFTSPDWSAKPEPVPYADPSDPQSLNQYVYLRNNPLGNADPDGHCGWDFRIVEGAIAVAATTGTANTATDIAVGAGLILSSAAAALESGGAHSPGDTSPGDCTMPTVIRSL